MKCETCQNEADVHIDVLGMHFCSECVRKIDARIAEMNEARDEAMSPLSVPVGPETKTIRSIGAGPDGKAFVVYLRDNIRISVGRTMHTHGPAWLEITETPILRVQSGKCEQ